VAASDTLYLDITAPEPHRIAYHCWGNPNAKETVVCAHGLSRNSRDFDFLAEALATDGFQVIAADMPGRGKSDNFKNTDNYNNLVYVQDVKALLDHLGIKKVHWIGTSMGGAMAMLMEAQHRDTIKSLVLNDIGCVLPVAGVAPIANYLGTPRPTDKEGLKRFLVNNWTDFAVPGAPQEKYWQHLFTHYLRENDKGEWKLAYDPAIVVAFGKAIKESKGDADFSGLCAALSSVPTLMIRGAKSTLLTKEIAQKTRALWKPETLFEEYLAPNAGHAPMLMNDEEIGVIRDWMSRQKSVAINRGGQVAR
jgi:pimeloyl-ACP methyl ester carboxylesterase